MTVLRHRARPDAFIHRKMNRASAFERAIGPQPVRPGNGGGRLFSGGASRAFPSRSKI